MKQDNPFAKLGALDQKLYQETTVKPQSQAGQNSGNPEIQNSRIPETQNTRKLDIKNSSIQEFQKPRDQEPQNSRIPENPALEKPAKREFFTKATYRLCDEALDAIEDAKKILKRQYSLKVNLEEIVETAVLDAYQDLAKNKEKSNLVATYSGIPENKHS